MTALGIVSEDKVKGKVDGIPFEIAVETIPLKDFDAFYTDQKRRLPALVRKVFRGRSFDGGIDPEDVVQDALVVAACDWERIGRMADPGKYVRTVAANRAERVVDKARREAWLFVDDFESLIKGMVSVEETVSADLVRDLLARLPHRRAQVLYFTADGWTDTQIGEQLGIAPATVRAHRHQVRKVFMARLREVGWDLDRALGIAG
ncbi:sigma factor-like helix-turn-helix DNA-binding protein [Streptomyces mirabilis]|uniref:RNA polymerase sigma factor n=1 Tax=Streptomyces mirabilis TaxID=68239 RepID=UPI0022540146|nr:sigma factor-like helix-turn-helix DNA-binding protein [Streptomyces mirabilis]MCX4617955.1 LuxR C-terminal-related transcriptional regulator [Streptomyces mirabilis]